MPLLSGWITTPATVFTCVVSVAVSNTSGSLADVALTVVMSTTPPAAVPGIVTLTVTGPLAPAASVMEEGLTLILKPWLLFMVSVNVSAVSPVLVMVCP